GETLASRFGVPVRVGNDVGTAVEGEAVLGAGRPFRTFLGLWWGTGVGGATIVEKHRWLGRGAAGESGHMVIKLGGARCTCGRRGCMEAYAGRGAMEIEARKEHEKGAKTELFKIMKKKDHVRLTSGIWERALDDGDKLAEKLIDRAFKAPAPGMSSATRLADVDARRIRRPPRKPYMKKVAKHMHKPLFVDDNPPALHVAELGDFDGAIGASLLFDA